MWADEYSPALALLRRVFPPGLMRFLSSPRPRPAAAPAAPAAPRAPLPAPSAVAPAAHPLAAAGGTASAAADPLHLQPGARAAPEPPGGASGTPGAGPLQAPVQQPPPLHAGAQQQQQQQQEQQGGSGAAAVAAGREEGDGPARPHSPLAKRLLSPPEKRESAGEGGTWSLWGTLGSLAVGCASVAFPPAAFCVGLLGPF